MTHSNIPAMLQREDFQARHSDMLSAARCEPLTKDEIEEARAEDFLIRCWPPGPFVDPRQPGSVAIANQALGRIGRNPHIEAAKARVWETMREYIMIGIDMAKPGSDRAVVVRTKLPEGAWRQINEGRKLGD